MDLIKKYIHFAYHLLCDLPKQGLPSKEHPDVHSMNSFSLREKSIL